MRVTVRPGTLADLESLEQHWPIAGEVHRSHLEEPDSVYLIAWGEDGAPCGSAVLRWRGPVGEQARTAFPDQPELIHLQVRPSYRGQGVGTELIRAAEAAVREQGRVGLSLSVDPDHNLAAARLYLRLGYRWTGVRDTVAYDWIDEAGHTRHARETSELMVSSEVHRNLTHMQSDA